MPDHKAIAAKLKQALPGVKFHFSTSPRKGNKSLWVFKMESQPERVNMLNCLIETGEVKGWDAFFSKDKSTTGLQMMVTL